MKRFITRLLTGALLFAFAATAHAAGTLTPRGSGAGPIEILDHHVDVVINNGFARTEVTQRFHNPNDQTLEAIYAFPVPRSASLSEVSVMLGEREIHGEVIAEEQAESIYEQEKSQGNDTAMAQQDGYQRYRFRVANVQANGETRIRFVYYQPISIDTGVGRYVYPLADGGTDEQAEQFWTSNSKVQGMFSADIELKSSWPVAQVRMPAHPDAKVTQQGEGHYHVQIERHSGASLTEDLVFYYKLQENLPGRVEMLTYRPDPAKPGTFMMILTPGLDLQPLNDGSDYLFVLDVSGSMGGGKLRKMADGVSQTLGTLNAQDRFRIILFDAKAQELTRGWHSATPEQAERAIQQVSQLSAGGSTNLHAGLRRAISDLDDDRATSLVLVTDAVTNTGVVDPAAFHKLMAQYDVRVFGFLMGNSANWPLMRTITEASGGFFQRISTSDDLIGRILQARGKVTHEALHDAKLRITGVETTDLTRRAFGKVYHGEQLVIFGRYETAGNATLTLDATLTGEDKRYTTQVRFPETSTLHPELERLWALDRVKTMTQRRAAGLMDSAEAEAIIRELGVDYQIVTDDTAMLLLSDEAFERHGIDRRNEQRTATEHRAQTERDGQKIVSQRADDENAPMFGHDAPSPGGGAIGPVGAALALGIGGLAWVTRRRQQRSR